MSNSITPSGNVQIKVPFHGAELFVVEHDGQPYTPMKPIVDGMGLAWQPQHRKLAENGARWGITEMVMPSAGGRQAMVCVPLRKLPGWLMSIEPGKVKDAAVRDRVIRYQNECDDALWQYWSEGIAVNPRAAFSVNPEDVLTGDQQETLRLMVKTLVERLPKSKQGGAAIKVWSKLKAHFKVAYRQIPQHEFSEAVSIVTRTVAEWEVVDEDPEPVGIKFVVPKHGRYLVVSEALGSYVYNADGMNLVANDDIARMKRDMRTLGDALVEMRQRMRVFTGEEDRVILLKPVAIDMHVM